MFFGETAPGEYLRGRNRRERIVSGLLTCPGDRVEAGQARASFDFGRYGGIEGKLTSISPTRLMDERGQPYFTGIVELARSDLSYKGDSYSILPGMSLAVDLRMGSKTILGYLLKPVFVSAREAFRER